MRLAPPTSKGGGMRVHTMTSFQLLIINRLSYDTTSLHPQGTPGGMLFTKTEDVVLTSYLTSCTGNMVMEEYRALGT